MHHIYIYMLIKLFFKLVLQMLQLIRGRPSETGIISIITTPTLLSICMITARNCLRTKTTLLCYQINNCIESNIQTKAFLPNARSSSITNEPTPLSPQAQYYCKKFSSLRPEDHVTPAPPPLRQPISSPLPSSPGQRAVSTVPGTSDKLSN